jgi:YHS domain-containing protein
MPLILIDPVCSMFVDPDGAITEEYEGQTYYFCEPVCQDTFNDEPERWARSSPKREGPVDTAVTTAVG